MLWKTSKFFSYKFYIEDSKPKSNLAQSQTLILVEQHFLLNNQNLNGNATYTIPERTVRKKFE